MSKVALLLPYKLSGKNGPEIFLQLHSTKTHWRFFGGHIKPGESPLDAVGREINEELDIAIEKQKLSEGWTVTQLISRLRIPFGGIYIFPIEVNEDFPKRIKIQEGADGRFWPLKDMPENMSFYDKLLIKIWILRRFVLNQPYIVTSMKSPVITLDLEEPWHYAGRLENSRYTKRDYEIAPVIEELLTQLELAQAKATFFCVASIAEKYHDLIKLIVNQGHEVGSHSVNHELVKTLSLKEFQKDVYDSKKMIEDISGERVISYRAPAWSWPKGLRSEKYYEILQEAGYLCNSSVIPSSLFGIPGLPNIPYKTDQDILEFPLPTAGIPIMTKNLDRLAKDGNYIPTEKNSRLRSLSIPYSGGLFKRCLGSMLSNFILSYHLKKRGYVMTHVHPRELSGEDASWIKVIDDRYFNLYERWSMGFRTKQFKHCFFSFLAKYSGCSIKQFYHCANYD